VLKGRVRLAWAGREQEESMSKKGTQGTASKKRTSRKRAAEPSERAARPARNQAPFAITNDGTLLLNVDALDPLDVAALEAQGRTLFIGAELQEHEGVLAREMLDDAGHDLRSRIAGAIAAPRATVDGVEGGVALQR
jgi:hypothetical protein